MDQQQLLEHYKESYYHEFQLKDSINNRVALPAGILPLLVAGDIYLIKHLGELKNSWEVWGIILVALFSLFIILALYFICRTIYNHKYAYVASPKEIFDYHKSLEGVYNQQVIEEEMTEYLSQSFSDYGHINRQSNFDRVRYLRLSFFCIVGTLIVGLLCVPVFTIGEKIEDEDIIKIEFIVKEVIVHE